MSCLHANWIARSSAPGQRNSSAALGVSHCRLHANGATGTESTQDFPEFRECLSGVTRGRRIVDIEVVNIHIAISKCAITALNRRPRSRRITRCASGPMGAVVLLGPQGGASLIPTRGGGVVVSTLGTGRASEARHEPKDFPRFRGHNRRDHHRARRVLTRRSCQSKVAHRSQECPRVERRSGGGPLCRGRGPGVSFRVWRDVHRRRRVRDGRLLSKGGERRRRRLGQRGRERRWQRGRGTSDHPWGRACGRRRSCAQRGLLLDSVQWE